MQKVIFLLIFLSAALSLSAQFSVGVRQGYSAHGVYLEPKSLVKYQTPYMRPNSGLVIIFNNINNAGLQAEINYAQKGWMEVDSTQATRKYYMDKGDTLSSDPYFKRNINYLEIPIFSHFEAGYGPVRFLIFAGPYLAWKLSESIESENFDHLWYAGSNYVHFEQKIRDLDFGIKAGLGLRYNINPHLAIYMDARYDIEIAGGRDIFKDHPDGIKASRLKEIGGSFGILWHIIPQKKKEAYEGYTPKEDLYENE